MTNHRKYKYNGRFMCVCELAETANCSITTMITRLRTMSVEESVNPPRKKQDHTGRLERAQAQAPRHEYKGQQLTIRELAALAGVAPDTLRARMKKMTVAEAVEWKRPPKQERISNKSKKPVMLWTYKGKEYTINELADMAKCSAPTMRFRLGKWTVEQAVHTKVKVRPPIHGEKNPKFWYNDELLTIEQLAELAGCEKRLMSARLLRNNPRDAVAMGPYSGKGRKKRQ